MTDHGSDPTIQRLRREIFEVDRRIVDAVNSRLELVARLKSYKESAGIPFVDPDRERQLLDELILENRGPLTPEGLRELYAILFDLTKRQVTRDDVPTE